MFDLVTPLSDVASNAAPYLLVLILNGNPRADLLSLHVQLRHQEQTVESTLELEMPPVDDDGKRTIRLAIDPATLAVGEYSGTVRLNGGDAKTFSFYRVAEQRREGIPFGIYAFPVPESTEAQDTMLREWQAAGIDLVTGHMHTVTPFSAFYDRAARFGMTFRPSMRFWDPAVGREWFDAFKGTTSEHEPRGKAICLFRPDLRAKAAANVAENLTSYTLHPAFDGSVYFGDDLFLPSVFQAGRAALGCYCELCKEAFRQETGQEPPETTGPMAGAVPPDDPWLLWNRFRTDRQFADFYRVIQKTKNAVDPSIVLGPMHGPPDNPFNQLGTGIYGPRTQVMDAVSSYAYPFLRSPASDFIVHYELGRMGQRHKPVWMLGFLEGDRTMAPDWHVTQSYWNMLAAGYKTIAFFSWYGLPTLRQSDDAAVRRRVEDAITALARCGEHKQWIFPIAARWERPVARFAQLYSFTTEAYDIAPVHRHHLHLKRVAELYRLALARQIELDLICEEEVIEGSLEKYDVVLLHDVRALRGDVHAELHHWSAREGKRVFVDRDLLYNDGWHPHVRMNMKKATELTPAAMIELLDREAGPRVRCDHADAILRAFTGGVADYLVLANNFPERVVGMPYSYGDEYANYRHADLVPNKAIDVTLTFPDADRWLFDAATGKAVGRTDQPLQLSLEPAWGRVLVSLPTSEATVAVELLATAALGETIACDLQLRGADGQALAADVTVKLSVNGDSRFIVLAAGKATVPIRLPINAKPGEWTVTVEGGFPRRVVTQALSVTVAETTTAWLRME